MHVHLNRGARYHMKQAGFVVTLVPMSTQVYTGEEDASGSQVMRNEFVKYRPSAPQLCFFSKCLPSWPLSL